MDTLNGVTLLGDGQAEFRVWAPAAQRLRLRLMRKTPTVSFPERSEKDGARQSDQPEEIEMRALGSSDFGMPDLEDTSGNLFSVVTKAGAGDRYFYVVDNEKPVPDPVSRYQPEGVHGPAEIMDPEAFRWSDGEWRGVDLAQYVIYELHVG